MFFQRFGPETAHSADDLVNKARVNTSRESADKSAANTRRKRATALSLAVAMTNPLGLVPFAMAHSNTPSPIAPPAQSMLSADVADIDASYDNDTLRLASDQFKSGDYEEALATLQSVKVDSLSAGDKSGYDKLLARVTEAVDGRKAARATFEQGEQSLAAGKVSDALTSYRAVAGNKFADTGTRNKAAEQIALAEEQLRNQEVANKATYQDARSLLAKGDLAGARAEFQKLSDAGFKPGLFQRSPADYIQEIDGKMGTMAPAAMPTAAAAPTTAPSMPMAADAPMPAAPAAIQQISPPATPAPMAAPMAAPATPATPTMTAPAPSADVAAASAAAADAEAAAAKAKLVSSTAAYESGLTAYRKGDWIEARKQFTVAQETGYKGGLFDRGPAFYLRLMDEKEQADAAKMASASAPMASATPAPAVSGGSIVEISPAPTVTFSVTSPTLAPAPAAVATPATAPIAAAPMTSAPMTPPAPVMVQPAPAAPMSPTAAMAPVVSKENARKAQDLVTQARAAQARGDLMKASDLYAQAVATDPTNTAARSGQADVSGQIAAHASSGGLLTEQEKAINARRQLVQYQFDTALAETKADIQTADFGKAQTALDQAKIARSSDPGVFSAAELSNFDTAIAATQADLEKARESRAVIDNDQRNKDTTQRALVVAEARRKEKERQVAGLIRTTRQAIEEQRYEDALKLLDQILVIDPRNDYATGVRQLVEDKAIVQQQLKYQRLADENLNKTLNSLDEKRIPYDDYLRYPENWPDISSRRDAEVDAANGFGGGSSEALAVLDKRVPELKFDNAAFGDAIDFMRDIAEANGANLVVRWKKLEAAGVERTTPVTLRLASVRFAKGLDMLLDNVGASAKLSYAVDEGVIVVSTDEDLAGERKLKVYDVRDILFDPAQTGDDQFPKLLNVQQQQQSSGGSQYVSSNNTSPFNGGGGGGGGRNQNDQQEKQRLDDLIQTIKDQTGSDQWSDGGGQGDIKAYNETLLVSTTVKNHGKVQELLDKLRSQSSVQVAIEARFLTVQKNFLDDFGINWNLNLNINGVNSPLFGSTGLNGTNAFSNTIPISQQSGLFTQNPTTGAPGSLGSVVTTPSLQTAVSFLDDFGVDLFIRATQASQNSTSLSAPRVTLFSGSVAEVEVTEDQYYIDTLIPIVSSNAVGNQPHLNSVSSGTHLRVRATVSQDRKYVNLNIYPELVRLRSLQTFQINSITFPSGTNGTGIPITSSTPIQAPLIDVTALTTSARVPDGGTLLLGGQIISAEVEEEAGVPVLSKIPFIKRLFTNRSTAKDEQVILILVKPTIIISEEQENKQFPLLNSKPQQ